ncbi:hypothetical protein [Streptomyces sp. LS1784]|uniref:hypothetical protein n=1 Tax=Streptomyces sp. LS1784 TaxID=2851533 RepID=UPI001CCF6907|nr:hypothetical protein [Streptomyces sp. LS1784]
MNENSAANPWRRAAAPLTATVVLAVSATVSWFLFHRDLSCWGKGPGYVYAQLGTIVLGGLGVLALAGSWLAVRWAAARTAWMAAVIAALLGLATILLAHSPNCG